MLLDERFANLYLVQHLIRIMKFLVALIALLTGMTITLPGEASARAVSAPVAAAQLIAAADGLSVETQITAPALASTAGRISDDDRQSLYINSLPAIAKTVLRADRARE